MTKRLIVLKKEKNTALEITKDFLHDIIKGTKIFSRGIDIIYSCTVTRDDEYETINNIHECYDNSYPEHTIIVFSTDELCELKTDFCVIDYYNKMLCHIANKEYIQQKNRKGIEVDDVEKYVSCKGGVVKLGTGDYAYSPIVVKSKDIKSTFGIKIDTTSKLENALMVFCEEDAE